LVSRETGTYPLKKIQVCTDLLGLVPVLQKS